MKISGLRTIGPKSRLRSKRTFDPSLYLVVGPADLRPGADLVAVVDAAVRGGVSLVQLRAKEASLAQLSEMAKALKALLEPRGVPLIVNDRAEAVLVADADGLHVGQDDLPTLNARMAVGRHRLVGGSAGDRHEAKAIDLSAIDYLGVGPVYASPSKADAGQPIGLEGLWDVTSLVGMPVVAIGGITAETAGACIKTGAVGVAVVSAIAAAEDPYMAARALRTAVEQAQAEAL